MSPASLAKCSARDALTPAQLAASAEVGLAVLGSMLLRSTAGAAAPSNNSVLYNSMIAPLLLNPKRGISWCALTPALPLYSGPRKCLPRALPATSLSCASQTRASPTPVTPWATSA